MARNLIASPHFEVSSRAHEAATCLVRRDHLKLKAGMRRFAKRSLHSILSCFPKQARKDVLSGHLVVHQIKEFFILLRLVGGRVFHVLDIIRYAGHVVAEYIRYVIAVEIYFEGKSDFGFTRRVCLVETRNTVCVKIRTKLGSRTREVTVCEKPKPRSTSDDRPWDKMNRPYLRLV